MATEPLSTASAIEALQAFDDDTPAPPVLAKAEKKKNPPPAAVAEPTPDPDNAADEGDDADEQEIEADADASSASEDDTDGEETPTDGDEEAENAEPAEPAIEPPAHFGATEREAFKALPRKAQELLLQAERGRLADYTRKTQEIAAQRKSLEKRLETVGEVMTERAKRLSEWRQTNWPQLAQQVSAEEYNAYKAQHEAEEREYAQLSTQREAAEAEALRQHDQIETAKMRELAPELLNGEEGEKLRKAAFDEIVRGYQRDGLDADEIDYRVRRVKAFELLMVVDAQRWRALQAAKAKQPAPALKPKQDAPAKGKPIRPVSRQSPSSVANTSVKNFRKAPTLQNAMRALEDLD
jgi:hypothetical protein